MSEKTNGRATLIAGVAILLMAVMFLPSLGVQTNWTHATVAQQPLRTNQTGLHAFSTLTKWSYGMQMSSSGGAYETATAVYYDVTVPGIGNGGDHILDTMGVFQGDRIQYDRVGIGSCSGSPSGWCAYAFSGWWQTGVGGACSYTQSDFTTLSYVWRNVPYLFDLEQNTSGLTLINLDYGKNYTQVVSYSFPNVQYSAYYISSVNQAPSPSCGSHPNLVVNETTCFGGTCAMNSVQNWPEFGFDGNLTLWSAGSCYPSCFANVANWATYTNGTTPTGFNGNWGHYWGTDGVKNTNWVNVRNEAFRMSIFNNFQKGIWVDTEPHSSTLYLMYAMWATADPTSGVGLASTYPYCTISGCSVQFNPASYYEPKVVYVWVNISANSMNPGTYPVDFTTSSSDGVVWCQVWLVLT